MVPNLNQAIEVASQWNKDNSAGEEIVLIGGGYVFEESKNIVNKLVLTRVECEINGDVFYPQIDLSDWKEISHVIFLSSHLNQFVGRIRLH